MKSKNGQEKTHCITVHAHDVKAYEAMQEKQALGDPKLAVGFPVRPVANQETGDANGKEKHRDPIATAVRQA